MIWLTRPSQSDSKITVFITSLWSVFAAQSSASSNRAGGKALKACRVVQHAFRNQQFDELNLEHGSETNQENVNTEPVQLKISQQRAQMGSRPSSPNLMPHGYTTTTVRAEGEQIPN